MSTTQVVIGALLLGATACSGAVVPIAPFTGERSDPLDYPGQSIVARFNIFNNTASLSSSDGLTTIHYLVQDTFSGDLATPRTGGHLLGFTQGPGIFEFTPAVRRFGMYFNNNSGQNDAVCDFFGVGNVGLGSLTATTPAAGNVWVWNGWESDVPMARVVVTGNGVIHGFLWFDDLELSVPAPGVAVACLAGALVLARRRR